MIFFVFGELAASYIYTKVYCFFKSISRFLCMNRVTCKNYIQTSFLIFSCLGLYHFKGKLYTLHIFMLFEFSHFLFHVCHELIGGCEFVCFKFEFHGVLLFFIGEWTR